MGAVAEFKVLTNQYSAEYGTTTSGIVVAATKSGRERRSWRSLLVRAPERDSGRPAGLALPGTE